jgi:hypothetical protein
MWSLLIHGVGSLALFGLGYYCHYRFGSKVASTIALVETDIKKMKP